MLELYDLLADQWREERSGVPVMENSEIESAMQMLGVPTEQRLQMLQDVKVLIGSIRAEISNELERKRLVNNGTTQR